MSQQRRRISRITSPSGAAALGLELQEPGIARDAAALRELEEQHQVLLELAADLIARGNAGAPKAELVDRLCHLYDCTLGHFELEEQQMQASGYARLAAHRSLHADISASLRRHLDELEAGDGRLGSELSAFLEFWLVPHIKGFDTHALAHARKR